MQALSYTTYALSHCVTLSHSLSLFRPLSLALALAQTHTQLTRAALWLAARFGAIARSILSSMADTTPCVGSDAAVAAATAAGADVATAAKS